MPDIEITPDQRERLRDLQAELADDVVGKYGHVRPQDAIEYLLDRHAEAAGAAEPDPEGDSRSADEGDAKAGGEPSAGAETESGTGGDGAGDDGSDGAARVDAMMSLLEDHDDRWRESDGDGRYEVELPDGTTEAARTKDDVRAVLFEHYR